MRIYFGMQYFNTMALITIYGKRDGKGGMTFYKDRECNVRMCHTPYHYYRKNRVVTLCNWKWNLIVL